MAVDYTYPVTVVVFGKQRYDGDWMPEKLTEAIEWLLSHSRSIPLEYRDSATIEIDSESSYEDSHYASIEISYQRPPTAEEVASRRDAAEEQTRRDLQRAQQQAAAAERRLSELQQK